MPAPAPAAPPIPPAPQAPPQAPPAVAAAVAAAGDVIQVGSSQAMAENMLLEHSLDDLWGEVTSMMAGAGLLPLRPGIPMAPPSAVATTVQTTETIFVE